MSDRKRRKMAQKEATRIKRRLIEKVLANSKTSNSVFNLNFLAEGWLELESDPGTFSLLLEDFGCHGAQVEEIYDLEQKFDSPVLGFIFLFKWLHNQPNDRRSQKGNSLNSSNNCTDESAENGLETKQWSYVTNEETISQIFFAKQTISNSCATHALISILLNCDHEKLNLGPALTRLKEHTVVMNPENKGYAIGNLPELAKAHNSHASYSSLYNRDTSAHSGSGMSYMLSGNLRTNLQQNKNHESYHFVSYIPINGHLYELDGLKKYPIDHGPPINNEEWTEKFRRVIKQRIQENKLLSNEIRYNLMAVVPDKRISLQSKLRRLRLSNRVVEENIKIISSPNTSLEIPNPPYSPLSNGTVTASEVGSVCNSPNSSSGIADESDKYFLIKFDPNLNTYLDTDNQDSAHKNSMINPETSSACPLDLSSKRSNEEQINTSINDDKCETETNDNRKVHKSQDVITNPMIGRPPIVQSYQLNAIHKVEETKLDNLVQAHADQKYNLSDEPPFDFNILDDLQHVHSGKSVLRELQSVSDRLNDEIQKTELLLKEEVDKRLKFKIDNSRRTHNYEPFIMTFLSMLAKQGKLADLIEKDLGMTTENTSSTNNPDPLPRKQSKIRSPPRPTLSPHEDKNIKKIQGPRRVGRPSKNRTPQINNTNNNVSVNHIKTTQSKSKYVKTGKPVGRPRKYPLVPVVVEKKDVEQK